MKNGKLLMTLCGGCKAKFEDTGANYIRRVNLRQQHKELCTYCSQKYGWDYHIIPKDKKPMHP